MNASTTFSDVEMQINDCMFCPNGEVIFKALLINPNKISNIIKDQNKNCLQAVQVILNTIGTRVWNEAERLLVDLLQQVPESSDLLEIAMFHDISKISNLKIFAFFTLSHKYFQCEFHQLIRKVTDLKTLL